MTKKASKKKQHTKHDPHEDHVFVEKALGEDHDNEVEEEVVDRTEDIGKKLTEIYENEDGSMPDMKRFQTKERSKMVNAVLVLIAACAFLGAVAWLGFFIVQPRAQFSEEDVIFSVSGEEEIAFGEEITYRIRYRNAQNVPLAQALLQVRYPKGFVFKEAGLLPTKDSNDEWSLGTIPPQGSGYIDVTGMLYGDEGSKQSIRTFLNYTPANFSSEFQRVANVTTQVVDAPLELDVSLPEESVTGEDVTLTIALSPKEDSAGPVRVVVDPGEHFTKKQSSPQSDEFSAYEWSFDDLSDQKEITLTGVFHPDDDGTQNMQVLVYGTPSEKEDAEYVLGEKEVSTEVLGNSVSVTLLINGTRDRLTLGPGDDLHSSIIVRNNARRPLEDVRVRMIFDAPSVDNKSILHWAQIEEALDADIVGEQINEQTRRGYIKWTSRHLRDLGSLSPGDEVSVDFHLPIKTAEVIDLTEFTTHNILASAEIQYDIEGEREILSGNSMNVSVHSDTALEVRSSEKGSDYIMTWLVSNTFHELENIVLEADIYGDIAWLEDELVVPAGQAIYDEDQGRIRWTIDRMPTALDVLALRFGVKLNERNPTQTNLTSKVRVSARDVITGEEILVLGDEVLLGE